jgi:crotonobetainyl-CoA:carnitine CoA-transferase CaiB-like acyl-CoA transferase
MAQLYQSEHLRERNFFVPLEQPGVGTLMLPGTPSKYGKTRWTLRRPAPRMGEHTDQIFRGEPWNLERIDRQASKSRGLISGKEPTVAEGPLSGVRVLDFSGYGRDPTARFNLPIWELR